MVLWHASLNWRKCIIETKNNAVGVKKGILLKTLIRIVDFSLMVFFKKKMLMGLHLKVLQASKRGLLARRRVCHQFSLSTYAMCVLVPQGNRIDM